AQGALAVEIASHREDLKKILSQVHCQKTWEDVREERKILKSYGGGCHQKIGVTRLTRDYGLLLFLKGLTDGGEVLDKRNLYIKGPDLKPSEAKAITWFDRHPIEYKMPQTEGHFVARANSLPEDVNLDGKKLWVSGTKTWEKLAQRGYWVHGTFESLGEQEGMSLEQLSPGIKWAKWSHKSAPLGNWDTQVATYELIAKKEKPDIKDQKNFYWMSASSFSEAQKHHPDIVNAQHYCGPGNTYRRLTEILKNFNNKPSIVLDFEQWKSFVKKDNS
ncbi:MAG: hydroxymethylbilane synthase, partial [Bdellovibrionales bacterium]|nr:hydroxymethylbilane synthase [Bdellovibrionales bacterium]NQZ19119.1 hydroxymethylbilane synthase [Bdellovibrionales bacterium]